MQNFQSSRQRTRYKTCLFEPPFAYLEGFRMLGIVFSALLPISYGGPCSENICYEAGQFAPQRNGTRFPSEYARICGSFVTLPGVVHYSQQRAGTKDRIYNVDISSSLA